MIKVRSGRFESEIVDQSSNSEIFYAIDRLLNFVDLMIHRRD
jgi:hypothetical protein